jgi:DNA-binding NarL/FixJ family response regulator
MATIRILIADDHDGFRRSLSAFLSVQPGVEIIGEARDGVEAVDKAAALRPTLVLMDLDMPNRDGFEATRQIKSLVPDTRVVILSIYGDDVYRRMAWKYSADGFIDKSAMKRALVMLIANEQARLVHSPMQESAA